MTVDLQRARTGRGCQLSSLMTHACVCADGSRIKQKSVITVRMPRPRCSPVTWTEFIIPHCLNDGRCGLGLFGFGTREREGSLGGGGAVDLDSLSLDLVRQTNIQTELGLRASGSRHNAGDGDCLWPVAGASLVFCDKTTRRPELPRAPASRQGRRTQTGKKVE